MKAVVLTKPTKAEDIVLSEVEVPTVKPGWVLVKIKAFGLNHSEQILREFEIEKDYIRTIQEASKSLISIVDDVLDFSKIDANRIEMKEEEYLFEEMMQGVTNIIASRLEDKDIRLETSYSSLLPKKLKGDRGKIQQILINIL